jgi:hypothetical protein
MSPPGASGSESRPRRSWEDRLEAIWRWAITVLGGRRRERLISIVSLVPETTARGMVTELRRRRAERVSR